MSHSFITDNFLLENKWSERLYHEYAAHQPIIDFHSYIPPRVVAEDIQYDNCTPLWIENDPRKALAMKTLGVQEEFISGEGSDEEKFMHWAAIVPYLVGSPTYHLTHLELVRYFEFEDRFDAETAGAAYEITRQKLRLPSHSARGLLRQRGVEVLSCAMDPCESLAFHRTYLSHKDREITLIPGFQPDAVYTLADPVGYRKYLETLEHISHTSIRNYEDLLQALRTRALDFHELGCRVASHKVPVMSLCRPDANSAGRIFDKVFNGKKLSPQEIQCFQSEILVELCRMYNELGWVQQFFLGTMEADRDTLDFSNVHPGHSIFGFLQLLDAKDELARTVLYPSDPNQNDFFAHMATRYNDGHIRGKVQLGGAWSTHFNKPGIERQLRSIANYGTLSCFIGMPSLSRSPLGYSPFEYFRRILCNYMGQSIDRGELPGDIHWLGAIISDICYDNAKVYFNL